MKWQLIAPATEAQWQAYYQLRYQVLRAPWLQPPGSERDELEDIAVHRMIQSATGEALAVGRLHLLDAGTAQVRYMAVSEQARGQGLGQLVLQALEQEALALGVKRLILNARDSATGFYQQAGYQYGAMQPALYGIPHQQMWKNICLDRDNITLQRWSRQLVALWHQTIPLSAFMQLDIEQFDGSTLYCNAALAPNQNLHHTMFAGSIYTLATLTAWGLVYLQLKDLGLEGDIVLADGQIRYQAPLRHQPRARASLLQAQGSLQALAQGKKVRQSLKVELLDGEQKVAEFEGRFVVLPKTTGQQDGE